MTIEIKKLPSGFYSVWVNGEWVNAACGSIEMAKTEVYKIVKSENKRQNKKNAFTNIEIKMPV